MKQAKEEIRKATLQYAYELLGKIADDLLEYIINEFKKIIEIPEEKTQEQIGIEKEIATQFGIKDWNPDIDPKLANKNLVEIVRDTFFRSEIRIEAEGLRVYIMPDITNEEARRLLENLNESREIISEEKLTKKIEELIEKYGNL